MPQIPQKPKIYKGIMCFVFCETLFYSIYTFPWALGFQVFISTVDKKHCQDPMWWWCNFTNYFFWSMTIWNFISIPVRYFVLSKEVINETRTLLSKFIETTKLLQALGSVLCFIMLMRAYEYRWTCLSLAPIVKLFLICSIFSLIVWCSGTYLIYVRLWKKTLEWVKKMELKNEPVSKFRYDMIDAKILKQNQYYGEKKDDEIPLVSRQADTIAKTERVISKVKNDDDEEQMLELTSTNNDQKLLAKFTRIYF